VNKNQNTLIIGKNTQDIFWVTKKIIVGQN